MMISPEYSAHKDSSDVGNPFRIPEHNNLFLMINKEKTRRKLECQRDLASPVYEKVTFTGRMRTRQFKPRVEVKESNTALKHTHAELQDINAWRGSMITNPNNDKSSIGEYITKKKGLFLIEYSLTVKRGEIERLKQMVVEEEKKLAKAEKFLEDNNILFEEFLKENDKNSMEAIKIARQETKAKLQRIAEIKKITSKTAVIRSDISKYEETLKEYKHYKEFLFKLSPPEWQDKQKTESRWHSKPPADAVNKESDNKQTENIKKNRERKTAPPDSHPKTGGGSSVLIAWKFPSSQEVRGLSNHSVKSTARRSRTCIQTITTEKNKTPDSSDSEEVPELLFTNPQELLDLMTELEEQNLSLIQNCRETEETLEKFRQTAELTCEKMESESKQLKDQIDMMIDSIQRERKRAADLQLRATLFSFGKYKPEDQDETLDKLSYKVEEVYRCCVGKTEANLSTLQMLTSIEEKLGELLENADMIPQDCMSQAKHAKEKERRMRLRDKKMGLQMKHQEERQKKALERSQAIVKKMCFKKLMPRSQPSTCKLQTNQNTEITSREKKELLYFFI